MVASPITAGTGSSCGAAYGDYTLTGDGDVAARHSYCLGGQPNVRGVWQRSAGGAVSSGKGWPGTNADR